MRYYCIMRKIYTEVIRPRHPDYGECTPEIRDTQCAFAILNLVPCKDYVAPYIIKALCDVITGVGAVRVDADCSNIRILYDGNVSALEQIEKVLKIHGLRVSHPEEMPSPLCLTQSLMGAA